MTWICYRGIELSARIQQGLLAAEVLILAAFAIVALVKVYSNNPAHSLHVSLDWFNPFAIGIGPLADGLLLGLFIYWGWDSGVSVNEETESSADAPGKAAVVSTLILVFIYLIVGAATQAFAGPGFLTANSNDVLSVLGTRVFGSPWDKLLIVAVLTSGFRFDPDDDPADRPYDVVDGALEGDPADHRPHPSQVPDAERLDAGDGRAVGRLDAAARRLRLKSQACSATRSPHSASRFSSTTASPAWSAPCTSGRQLIADLATVRHGRCRASGRLRGDVRGVRQGVHRLQQDGLQVRESDLRHPGADRDRHRRAAARRPDHGCCAR